MTEATNREHDASLQTARDQAAIAIPMPDDDVGGDVLTTILRAEEHGHHVFVYCDDRDSEIAQFARRLDATVVERDLGLTIEEQSRSLAREHGFPGVIRLESPEERLDFESSRTKLRNSSEYTVPASIEYETESNLIIGIPAYNEEVGIGSVILSAKSVASEVIVVDDGSSDDTVEVAKTAGATVIEHEENKGKGAAIQSLFETVREREFDTFVLLDGDGQHDPDEIPRVAEPIHDGESDLVIGSRYLESSVEDETPAYRRVGQRILDFLTLGPSKTRVTDSQSGFRALSPRAVDELAVTTDDFGVETQMIDIASRSNLEITERPIEARYEGIDGQTQNPLRHGLTVVLFILQLIRDKHPLAFFGLPGAICVILGGVYGFQGYLIYQNTGVFLPVKALGSGFIILLGMLCLFTGLILNSVSTMLEQIE